jgi:low affinity Fe/Cu permease
LIYTKRQCETLTLFFGLKINIFIAMAKKKHNFFERFSNWATNATGSSPAFFSAITVILIWLVTGPIFDYSDTWQLIINTGTTIVTFLMVFLIQKSQNKDSKAVHLKLNELLASHEGASNRMVDIEDLTEEELDHLHRFYVELSELAEQEDDLTCTHSIDAAQENHNKKQTSIRSKPNYASAKAKRDQSKKGK